MLRPPTPLESMMLLGCGRSGGGASFVGPLDAYTADLLAAISESRRLLASYAGALIRIRVDTEGSPEYDIGFTAAGVLDVADLELKADGNDAFLVTRYDQSGNGHDVTCATAAKQFRVALAGVAEVIGSQNRPCSRATVDDQGPYTSDTFTPNASVALTTMSRVYTSSSRSDKRYLSLTLDTSLDYDNANSLSVNRNGGNAEARINWNGRNLGTVAAAYDAQHTISVREETDGDCMLDVDGTSATSSGVVTIGFNRILVAGYAATAGIAGTDDRHMEHAVWQADLGVTAVAAIRAEQEAHYA